METRKKSKNGKGNSWKSLSKCIHDDYVVVKDNISLFLGLILISSGLLSFRSSRYCEGNTAEYYACTNPTTYYYYSTFTIIVVVFGMQLLALWKVKKEK